MKIANTATGEKILYDISKIEEVEQSSKMSDTSPLATEISQQSGDVNAESGIDDRKWSAKDTDGNTLSKAQQEYFENSKIRNTYRWTANRTESFKEKRSILMDAS